MGIFCLSAASILRCESLSTIQNQVLIIPPALGLIFAVALVATKGGNGKGHLFLALDGFSYFFLALIDLLSHLIPAARTSLVVFKSLDIFIGASSFLSLVFYMIFLVSLSRKELLPFVPRRFHMIITWFLILLIPIVVTLNQFGSFLGVSYSAGPAGLAIGFASDENNLLWSFFTSFTLALLTTLQATCFLLTAFRIVKAGLDQRRIDLAQSDRVRLFKGVGWIAAGIKLGAIETLIGFAQADFGVPLTRRVFRFLGRACLSIGVVKGLDTIEDFQIFSAEIRGEKPSVLPKASVRGRIGNPRLSTFQHLSGSDSALPMDSRPSTLPQRGNSLTEGSNIPVVPEMTPSLQAGQRVTVHFKKGQAPVLQLRLSRIDLASPTTLTEISSRPLSNLSSGSRASTLSSTDMPPIPVDFPIRPRPSEAYPPRPKRPQSLYSSPLTSPSPYIQHERRGHHSTSDLSPRSYTSDSLSVFRNLVSGFPGLPPRVTAKTSQMERSSETLVDARPAFDVSRESSLKSDYMTKRVPVPSIPNPIASDSSFIKKEQPSTVGLVDPSDPGRHNPRSIRVTASSHTNSRYSVSVFSGRFPTDTAATEDPFSFDDDPLYSTQLGGFHGNVDCSVERPTIGGQGEAHLWASIDSDHPPGDTPAVAIADLQDGFTDPFTGLTGYRRRHEENEENLSQRTKVGLPRIKTVGRAPRRRTPAPVSAKNERGSIAVEHNIGSFGVMKEGRAMMSLHRLSGFRAMLGKGSDELAGRSFLPY